MMLLAVLVSKAERNDNNKNNYLYNKHLPNS